MLWCETTDSPHLCTMFLHISFIFFHIFLSFPFFLIVIFGLKESNRPTGWKFVLHRMQAAFFRCILLGLLSRAKLRATQTLHVSWARRARLGVEHVEYSEYSNRGWQHGSDNTVGLRPVHMSLLGSPGTWLSHAFQCFSKVRICHTVSDTTGDTAWKTFDWNMIDMCVVCGNRLDNFDCGKSTLKWLESFGICVQGYSAWILPRPFWWVVVSVGQHLNGQTSRASAPPSFDFFSRETKRRLFL